MDKNSKVDRQVIPYGELVLRPQDTRPIVISSPTPRGVVEISLGTADDMREALDWLLLVTQVCNAMLTVRRLKAANEKFGPGEKTSDDGIPF